MPFSSVASKIILLFPFLFVCILLTACQQTDKYKKESKPNNENKIEVIAYYSGGQVAIDEFDLTGVTQLIYSFLHLKGNSLAIDNSADSLTLQHLTGLKSKYPNLKVLLSLGGGGGCKRCSEVFASASARKEFATSTAKIINDFNADGIDLDWEYPVVPGPPGHPYSDKDKEHFTALVQELNTALKPKHIISFAAGGFPDYLEKSVDWEKVMPLIDHVNIMSYDLFHGYSKSTGHHTPLYPNDHQNLSVDQSVKYLIGRGVPEQQIVIGAAFYGRIWESVANSNQGLYETGSFKRSIGYNNLEQLDDGFVFYWDSISKAPYAYNANKGYFFTYDDAQSIALKTQYAKEKGLKGIMFWELMNDQHESGLLEVMVNEAKK